MSEYREIITRAVTGKGRKFTQSKHTISPSHRPTSILGCWVINHTYDAKKVDDTVEVKGKYDINVWYSHSDNTKTEVVTETVSYKDVVKLRYKDENSLGDDHEVIARVLQQPNCLEASIADKEAKVEVQVEREFFFCWTMILPMLNSRYTATTPDTPKYDIIKQQKTIVGGLRWLLIRR